MSIALDATYSIGNDLSGVGIYSREILFGLAREQVEERFQWCYRPHRILRSWRETLPENCSRRLLTEGGVRASVFHGLNQRIPATTRSRSVCTFHDLFVATSEYSEPEFRRRFAELARDAATRSDLIICVSQFTADQVRDLLGIESSRLRVIHHGIRPLGRKPAQRQPIILSVGAIQKRKNTDRLARAFERTPEPWRLILAGSSSGFGSAAILDGIRRSPARSRIEILGYVTPERLAELYSCASIFAFPSLDEGFGMPALEAMSAGVPVIASNRSALPEVCGDAALLVDSGSEEAIAKALNRLIEDEQLRCDLSSRGINHAAQFTWKAAVQKTWGVYRELC